MKGLEVAATIRKIDEAISFKAEASKNVRHSPRR